MVPNYLGQVHCPTPMFVVVRLCLVGLGLVVILLEQRNSWLGLYCRSPEYDQKWRMYLYQSQIGGLGGTYASVSQLHQKSSVCCLHREFRFSLVGIN